MWRDVCVCVLNVTESPDPLYGYIILKHQGLYFHTVMNINNRLQIPAEAP